MRANSTTEYIKAKESFYSLPVWKFSFLDRSCLSMIIRGIWIFDSQLDIENMKEGLKELLGYYPHLSGRIKDGIGVYLTNQGIPFTVVNEPGISLHSLQKSKDSDLIKHFSTPLATSRIKRGIDPLLTVKVARLRDASVLGVQCAHACMDGRSFYTMMENWGKICRKEDFEKPLLDQSLFPGPTVLSKEEIKQLAVSSGWKSISTFSFITRVLPKFVLGTVNKRSRPFYFSKKALAEIKNRIAQKMGHQVSTNVALSALLSKMCMKLYGYSHTTECVQLTVVDCRCRLASLPANFVGNASVVVPTPSFPGDASIEEIALVIRNTLKPILQNPSRELERFLELTLNVFSHRLPLFPFDVTAMYSKKPTVFHINNFSRFPVYRIDFGSGKPKVVIPSDLANPIFIWNAPPQKDGVEVYFSGTLACTIARLKESDPWMKEMQQYSL